MNLLVALEDHFERTPDGTVWTQVAHAYPYWASCLAVFDHVSVVARVREIPRVAPDRLHADGARVSFVGLPDYVGPLQFLTHAREIARSARRAFRVGDAVILRSPSPIGSVLAALLDRMHYPYATNVVGDPHDTFAPGVVEHPLRVVWRWWLARQLRHQCAKSVAAAYVTERYLQRRYPCPAHMTAFSDVDLTSDAFVDRPRPPVPERRLRLITVGSLARLYKAPDVLIRALASCRGQGLDLELVVVGDGACRPLLEALARTLGVHAHVHFLGQLTAGRAVRYELDRADLFVLASRTEGLPRAALEAMARGLPCIGSLVGGIPELLPPADLVPPGDAAALSCRIREVVSSPARMAEMSARNLAKAHEYHHDILGQRRGAFHGYLRDRTQAWLDAHR